MKLSVSFRQVWHGAVWTLTTESSERSTRAGRNGQAHHMILQIKTVLYGKKKMFKIKTVIYGEKMFKFKLVLSNTILLSEKLLPFIFP